MVGFITYLSYSLCFVFEIFRTPFIIHGFLSVFDFTAAITFSKILSEREVNLLTKAL